MAFLNEQREATSGRIQIALWLSFFFVTILIHRPSRYYFYGDSWDVLYDFLNNWQSVLVPQNEHFIPLFKLLYLLQYKLFGAHHIAYELVLFAVHASCALVVYRLGRRLTLPPLPSAVAAFLFASSSVHWEIIGWSFEQQFALGALFLLTSMDVFLAGGALRWAGLLSLAAYLSGGPIAAVLPITLSVRLLLPKPPGKIAGTTTRNLIAYWLPAMIYFVLGRVASILVTGAPSFVPHLNLPDIPSFLDYALFGALYGTVLPGLTFLQGPTVGSSTLILILVAAAAALSYVASSSERQSAFWFLIVLLFAPLLVISLGRVQFGEASAAISRYTYIPSVSFALLVIMCWEAISDNAARKSRGTMGKVWAVLLLSYYFAYHFAVIRRQNPAAERGERSKQFLDIARRATYPSTAREGTILAPELEVPDYVYAPGRLPLWKAFQVLDKDTHRIAPVSGYLASSQVSPADSLIPDGDFETPESTNRWKVLGPASLVRSGSAAHKGGFGARVVLGPNAALLIEAIRGCPSTILQTAFTFSINARSHHGNGVVARILSRDVHGSVVAIAQSAPSPADDNWHLLIVSGLSAPGTCAVSADVTNTEATEIDADLDEAILVIHPGTVTSDGVVTFSGRPTLLRSALTK